MPDEIVRPFLVKYDGKDASRHILHTDTFGESLLGAARLYTAITHFCVFGYVPKPRSRYRKELACYAQQTGPGSVDQWLFIAPAIAGEYAIHARLYNEAISYIFGKVCDGIKDAWTRPGEIQSVVERLAAAFEEQARLNAEVQGQLAGGLVRANDNLASVQAKLIETLPMLAEATRSHGVRFVTPIGRNCDTIAQFAEMPLESKITEPEAEVIRGGGGMEVDQVKTFNVNRIKEINVIMDVDGVDGDVRGKITDPALQVPDNVYTRSLNDQAGCTVEAKAVRRNGAIERLYISNANPVKPRRKKS